MLVAARQVRTTNLWFAKVSPSMTSSTAARVEQGRSRAPVESAIFEWIEVFYNRERLHTTLGNYVPENPLSEQREAA